MSKSTGMFFMFDWRGRWALDKAGVETGSYSASELREMLDRGEIGPRDWLRHSWTGRFSLVGEVLYSNKKATEEEYAAWIPKEKNPDAVVAKTHPCTAPPVVVPPRLI
jgi:hypothetical protein